MLNNLLVNHACKRFEMAYGVASPLATLPVRKTTTMNMKMIKHISILLLLAICSLTVQAQDPELRSAPSIKTSDTTIKKILDELQRVTDSDKQNYTAIQALLQGREIDNRSKYELIRNNIINASETY